MTLRVIAHLTEGYGTHIAFGGQTGLWATVGPGQFHVLRGQELLYSVPLAGHFGGNPRFSSNGLRLFVGPRIFDLETREFLPLPPIGRALVAGLPPGSNARVERFEINGSAWSADGELLVVHTEHRPPRDSRVTSKYTGPWKRLLLLDGRMLTLITTLAQTSTSEESRSIAINDRWIAAAGLSVRAWDRGSLALVTELEGFNVSFRDLRFSSDGSMLAAPAWDGHVALWDTSRWRRMSAWTAHEDYARCVAFHPWRPVLATGGGDTKLNLWNTTRPGALSESLDLGAQIEGISFWPDGGGLAAALDDGRLVQCTYEA